MDEQGLFAATLLCASPRSIANGIVARQSELDPDSVARYSTGELDLTSDTEVRLGYLAEALAANRPDLFRHQVAWLKVLCASRGVPPDHVILNLECMREELAERLPKGAADLATRMVEEGIEHFPTAPESIPSYLEPDAPHLDLARRFLLAVLEARASDAHALALGAADKGVPIAEIQRHVLEKVQAEIGRMWQMAEVTIAEEHYCTEIVSDVTTLLHARAPRVASNGKRVLIASVSNEMHYYGVRTIAQGFEVNGFEVIYLGANTPSQALIDATRDFECDLIALSANIVLHVRRMANVVFELRREPVTANTPILVGGQPFNIVEDLWKVVGADGSASNVTDACAAASRLTGLAGQRP